MFSQENTTAAPVLEGDPFLSMPESKIEVAGVDKLLQNLNPGEASGPNNVPNRILKLCAKELPPMLTFVFDVVPHQRLLSKLDHYGVRGETHTWIRAFLTDCLAREY